MHFHHLKLDCNPYHEVLNLFEILFCKQNLYILRIVSSLI